MTRPPRLDQRVAKWRRWLEGRMRNEILTMNLHRSFWQQTQGIIVANETLPPSSWWEFISDLYGSSQASAVRRLVDPHDNGVSLRRMLDEMMQEPHLLTFDYFIGLIPPQPPSLGPRMRAWWGDHFAGDVDTHIDPVIVSADLDELTTATTPVVAHVDRHIAHSDPRPIRPAQIATLAEVHASIDAIGSLFRRYRTLLTGHTGDGLTPVIIDNWQAIFRQPWIT